LCPSPAAPGDTSIPPAEEGNWAANGARPEGLDETPVTACYRGNCGREENNQYGRRPTFLKISEESETKAFQLETKTGRRVGDPTLA